MSNARSVSLLARSNRTLQALVLAVGTTLAAAQPATSLPRSTVETISVNSGQSTQIQAFIDNWAPRLRSGDTQDARRALEALTEPLHGRGVSIAFRQSYSQALMPLIDELIASGSVQGKLGALRLSGDLATPPGVQRVRSMLNDEDAGVRLFAVKSAGRVLDATSTHGPAMSEADARSLIDAVANAAKDSQDEEHIRACARSLAEGTALGTRDLGSARSHAIVALSQLVGDRLAALTPNDDPRFTQSLALDAASATTQSISDITATINEEAARAAVRLGGDIISVPLRRIIAKTIEPQGERDMTVRSVQAGETLLYFARRKSAELKGQPVGGITTTGFSAQIKAGEDRDFRNQAAALLGPGGPIVTEFKLEDDRFLN